MGLKVTVLQIRELYIWSLRFALSFRGLYIGYLKLRTFVDAIHVVVQENCPNVLPHVKLRDNPNVSR